MFFHRKADERLRLAEVMRLRGAHLPDPLPAENARHLEEAKRRCLACHAKKLCDEVLSAGDANGFLLFCPNTHYIGQVWSRSLTFR